MRTLTASPSLPLSRYRLLLVLLAALGALLLLSACAEVDDETVVESDMERVEGGAAAVERVLEENNPGLAYQGMEKNGTDTVYTMTLEFSDAEDYAAKAQPVLAAGELTKTAEVAFVPPSPPFSSGYTMSRNFTSLELTRWAALAIMDAELVADAEDRGVDELINEGGHHRHRRRR